MSVTKSFVWTNASGIQSEVNFGAEAANINVSGTPLSTVITNQETRLRNLEESQIYSNIPMQIGTWLDGTPIWRVAYSYTFQPIDYSDIKYNRDIPIPYDIPMNAAIINSVMLLQSGNAPCHIDDHLIPASGYAAYHQIPDSVLTRIDSFSGVYGYFDIMLPNNDVSQLIPWT